MSKCIAKAVQRADSYSPLCRSSHVQCGLAVLSGDCTMDMRDIAKLAGVSSATVSRVINESSSVRPETAERVRRVIAEVKFFPNSSATTLKRGNSSTYGL